METSKYELALKWIADGLAIEPSHSELVKLQAECTELKVDQIYIIYPSTHSYP